MKNLVPFNYQGSKKKEFSKISSHIGSNVSICEPFLGSGIITGELGKNRSCIGNELNLDVFSIWNYAEEPAFIRKILEYCNDDNRYEEYYYENRKEYNKYWKSEIYNVNRAALFYYLLMSCHAGLLRYGPNGFNTSIKHFLLNGRKYQIEKRVKILQQYSRKFSKIHNIDALELLKNKLDVDVIYCDPPYTKSGQDYSSGWSDENLLELDELLQFQYSTFGVKSVLSNYENFELEEKMNFSNKISFSSSRMGGTKVVKKSDCILLYGKSLENLFSVM